MESGAEIITTNSYSTQPNYYSKGESLIRQELGYDKSLGELIYDHAKLSTQLASQAKMQFYQKHPDSEQNIRVMCVRIKMIKVFSIKL